MLYKAGYTLFQGRKLNEKKPPTFISEDMIVFVASTEQEKKKRLGGINFYLFLLRQKGNIFQSFCNSVLFPRRTKKKDCGCVFSEQVLNFAD